MSTQKEIEAGIQTKKVAEVQQEALELFTRKQLSYGSGNISAFGTQGVVIRLNDKVQRLVNMVFNNVDNQVLDEAIEDTFIDICNYGAIGVLTERKHW